MKRTATTTRGIYGTCIYTVFVLLMQCCSSTPLPGDVQQAYDALPAQVDFNFDVKPILSDRCFKCHGPDDNAREAGLRLDLADSSLNTRLESGNTAITPGRRAKSELVHRILHEDPDEQMPPVDARLQLSPKEKAMLIKWIDQGAQYKQHWSFIQPQKPGSDPEKTDTVLHPIDRFVREKLKNTGLQPSPETSKASWLRRVSFDLTGLPPTADEMDAFVEDDTPSSYERVVDRLLASTHYGERMAIDWLDLARYADTHGYQDDGYRFVWPWRDWVVKSFNDNQPYDQFLTWQLAGDLLPNATQEQRLATTFLRNHRINSEAGIIGEEYRVEYVADRINTVGTAIMGLTLECARCHDHKYDPISQKEYYQLFSYFNNVRELGEIANEGNPGPLMPLTTPSTEAALDSLKTLISLEESSLQQLRRTVKRASLSDVSPAVITNNLNRGLTTHLSFDSIEDKKLRNLAAPGNPASVGGSPTLESGHRGQAIRMQYYDVVVLDKSTDIERTSAFSVSLWVHPPEDTGYVPVWGNPGNKNQDYRGYELFLQAGKPYVRLTHAIPHNYIEIEAPKALSSDAWSHLVVTYDGSSKAKGLHLYVNGARVKTKTNLDRLYRSIKRGNLTLGRANARGGFADGRFDEFRYYNRPLLPKEILWLYSESIGVVTYEDSVSFFLETDRTYQQALHRLAQLRDRENQARDTIPEIMVMEEMVPGRPAYVLERGVYDAHREAVHPGTPAVLTSKKQNRPKDRLALAKWMTSPDHPLTARVAVNRFWQMLFGEGLVATPGDWGNQGALPSHPRLLDWLAVHFVESGWDVKGLLKEIVLSATYRQSSKTTPAHLEIDPDNVLLARGPAFRLPAEMLRDQALAASGLLAAKPGGPPVKPYQPEGLWEELAAIKNSISTYRQDTGESLYRRSLYTFWKRSSPPPSLAMFDAPTRELCLVQRPKTSTPLQALVLWNDPQFVEAARVLAERMMQNQETTDDRIILGFRLLTGRRPTEPEQVQLKALYSQQLTVFKTDLERAVALLSTGDKKRNAVWDPAELAAFAVVVQTIMSYDASVMRR